MKVIKRNGRKENVKYDKISARIRKQVYGLDTKFVDADLVSKKVIEQMYDGITSVELDDLAAEVAASLIPIHSDYSLLASRILITTLYKNNYICKTFSESIENLYNYSVPETGERASLISDEVYQWVMENKERLDSEIVSDRDFLIDYFGMETLSRAYLLKRDGVISETPQQMWMRVSCGINYGDLDAVLETYELMSQKFFTHATPTLFNAGTTKPQMSSCFLIHMSNDSIEGIYKTLSDTAKISQTAGGIGLSIHNIRGKGSYIKGTGGVSNGIVPMLRNYNETARYVDQGGGKRKGSFAVYLEPWHSDIEAFTEITLNNGFENNRTRDLFTAIWGCDLFFERVQRNEDWTLFSPDSAPGLDEVYGDEFNALYEKYEREGKGVKTIKAAKLYEKIIKSQTERGIPYILNKDEANKKSNHKNIGVIKSSNLCTEIMEYTSPEEIAVCNLASLALPMFVDKKRFDHKKLYDVVYRATLNLNTIIDRNYYPVPETKNSNLRHRPIGLGVQGLADVFAMMGYAFASDKAKKLNKEIFETIYFAALTASKDLAIKDGPYETFEGSPISKGIFQFDMWEDRDVQFVDTELAPGKIEKTVQIVDSKPVELSGMWDWDSLREEIKKHGVRNSLVTAPMPTKSTSQILGNMESFQPFINNLYKRQTLSGEFTVINKHLVKDLIKLKLWDENMSDKIILNEGSIQNIKEIPEEIRERYKTIREIKQRDLIDMSADRGPFVDQSQSFNLFFSQASTSKIRSAQLYGWKKGLKTISYYTHVSKDTAQKNNALRLKEVEPELSEAQVCSLENGADCEMCSG